MEAQQASPVGGNQSLPKMLKHGTSTKLVSEFERRHLHQRSNMAPKALRRRVLELVGDVGDRVARVLEERGNPNETRKGKIAFRRWKSGAKKTAHKGARD